MTYIFFYIEIIIFFLFMYSKDRGIKVTNKCLAISCILWTLIFGLRGYMVGNDSPNYAAYFENRNTPGVGYGTIDYPGDSIEWGFIAITRLLHFISDSATFFFLAEAVVLFFCIYHIYRIGSKSNSVWCLLLLNIAGVTFFSLMSMMRQTLSICVLFLALFIFYRYYENKDIISRKKRFQVMVLSASLAVLSVFVHRSSMMIFGGLFVIMLWKNTRKFSYIIMVASFVFAFFFGSLIGDLMDFALISISGFADEKIALLGDRYADTMADHEGMSLIRAMSYLIPMMVTIRYSEDDEINSFFFKCMIVAFSCQLLFSQSYMMNRLSIVFLVLGMCKFVPQAAMKKGSNLYVFYIIVTLYYLWRAFVGYGKWPDTDSTLPYYFFWE